MLSRNQAKRFFEVGAKLTDVAGPAGIVAGRLNSAACQARAAFETCDVISLPAVE